MPTIFDALGLREKDRRAAGAAPGAENRREELEHTCYCADSNIGLIGVYAPP